MIKAVLVREALGGVAVVELDPENIEGYYNHLHGGFIEAVGHPEFTMYVCDDFAKPKDLQPNPLATDVAVNIMGARVNGAIRGNVLLVGPGKNGNDTDVPDMILKAFDL